MFQSSIEGYDTFVTSTSTVHKMKTPTKEYERYQFKFKSGGI